MMASEFLTVDSRWAMTKTVRPGHQRIHTALHNGLGPGIDRASCLVEDHDRRIRNGSARNGEQLGAGHLTQVCTVAGQRGIVALRQTGDKVMRTCQFSGGNAFLITASSRPYRMLSITVR